MPRGTIANLNFGQLSLSLSNFALNTPWNKLMNKFKTFGICYNGPI